MVQLCVSFRSFLCADPLPELTFRLRVTDVPVLIRWLHFFIAAALGDLIIHNSSLPFSLSLCLTCPISYCDKTGFN